MGDQAGRIGCGSTRAAAQDALPVLDMNANGSRGAGDGWIDQAKEVVLSLWGDAGWADMEAVARARDAIGKHFSHWIRSLKHINLRIFTYRGPKAMITEVGTILQIRLMQIYAFTRRWLTIDWLVVVS